ncbi:MAG TPA: MBL fold metallo-hydrolase, partial [Solirubrobacterales bacterium]
MTAPRKPATDLTARRNREAAASLPPLEDEDFAEASRGLVATFEPATVTGEAGNVVWDMESYGFLDGEPPETAHPSLWRQSRLNRIAGLFEVAPRFY